MISDYFSLAFKSLKKRKLRSSLTVLGIIIAVATIFILISVSLGLEKAVEEQFQQLGTDKFFIFPKGQPAGPGSGQALLTENDVQAIEKVSGVKRTTFSVVGNAKIEFKDEVRFFQVLGIPLESSDVFLDTGIYKIEQGRFLKKGDSKVITLGNNFLAKNLFSKPVEVRDTLLINGMEFKVNGIMQRVGNPGDDQIILMPLEDFKSLFQTGNRVDQIVVQVESQDSFNEVVERVDKKLRSFRSVSKENQDYSILTPEELLATFGNFLNIVTAFLLGVAAISLLVGAIGISNTMYASILERTREIGVMKAVGAKNTDVLLIFVIESGLLGAIGGIIGVLIGMAAGFLIEQLAVKSLGTNLLQVSFPAYLILGCMLFAFLIGAVSGLWPAYRASKLKAVDALRYE